jgi:hypothetical protein
MKVTAREMDVICHALNVAHMDLSERAVDLEGTRLGDTFLGYAKGFRELADKLQEQLDEEVWGG